MPDTHESLSEQLQRFSHACAEVSTSGCVLAEKHISNLLKVIASAPDILDIVSAHTRAYDFESEFTRSKVPSGTNGFRLMPPVRDDDFIAYAFGVFLHIDLGDLDLFSLLEQYFLRDPEDINTAYIRFCNIFADRFCSAVLAAAGMQVVDARALESEAATDFLKMLDQCEQVIADRKLFRIQDEDLRMILGVLRRNIDRIGEEIVRAVFLGFCYAFSELGNVEALLTRMDRLYDALEAAKK